MNLITYSLNPLIGMIVKGKIKLFCKENVNYKMSFVVFIFENISLQQRKIYNLLRYLETQVPCN